MLCHKRTPENEMIYEKLKNNNYAVSFLDPLEMISGLNNNYNNYNIILSRVERDYLKEGIYALKYLETIPNIKIINNSDSIETCQNKYLTYLKLKEVMPKSFLTYANDFKNVENELKANNFNFPVVVKPIYGGYGNGVLKVNNLGELNNIFELLKNNGNELFVQELLDFKHDIRAFVINNKIICAMERIPSNNDWRANYSRGAKIKEFKLNKDTEKLILNSVKKIGANIVGVDVLIDKNNKPYILEMNITPQFRGIMNFADVPGEILKYLADILNKK
ncbi:ATP-grasp domain-containing protein [Methanococcus aeolicus]